ncbi:MAG: TetR/AcrR family transcriptional regulator [Myxococcota bacterium]
MPRPSTREKLLDCAESLFAEHGLARVSLRTINADAGLSPAALHYHFKTKEALIEALLERRMPALMKRRSALLDDLDSQPGAPTARDILDVIMRPLTELLAEQEKEGQRYLRLIYRLQTDGDLYSVFSQQRFSGGVDRLLPLLCRALPDMPPPQLELRLEWAIHLILRTLAGMDALPSGADNPPRPILEQLLLDFLTGGFETSQVESRAQ